MEQKILQLQPRLQLLSELVEPGSRLADIGTDHGYLPVYLIQSGKIAFAIAADVGSEPLQHAVRTAQEYGVSGIDFRLCDGLIGISPEEIDTIVIAGMGGETMIHILSAAPWTKTPETYHLILQPMTKIGELRRWLTDNEYTFTGERLVRDKDFLYPVLLVTGGVQATLSDVEQEYGVLLKDDPLYGEYLGMQIGRLRHTVEGMRRSEKVDIRIEAEKLAQRCELLQKMREELS